MHDLKKAIRWLSKNRLKSPTRKIGTCIDCGQICTGKKRCYACEQQNKKGRPFTGPKNPPEKLLEYKDGRTTYFSKKYKQKEATT